MTAVKKSKKRCRVRPVKLLTRAYIFLKKEDLDMKVITISREFGSGGRELGKRLAEQLGFSYYDKEILTAVAERSGLNEEYIEKVMGHNIRENYPITYGRTFHSASAFQLQKNKTELLLKQQQIIKEIAKKGDCVIVGRGADVILSEYRSFNLFVYASMMSKMNRCREYAGDHENMTERELKMKIQQIDRGRKQYYELLRGGQWGAKENYHLCINTTDIAVKEIIPAISAYAKDWFRRNEE